MKKIVTWGALLTALLLVPAGVQAQRVILHPQPSDALSQKWQWAETQAQQDEARRGYWIGYSIERLMAENSFMGSWSSRRTRTTLHEVLYGERSEFDHRDHSWRDGKSKRKVLKEVALLFEFRAGETEPTDMHVTNLSGYVDLNGRPLIWLEGAEDDESLDFLEQQYRQARSDDYKEELVAGLAVHDETGRVVPLLTDILTGNEATDIRESAAFWLSQQDDEAVLDVLRRAAETDRSEDVREQAVFGISQVDVPEATEVLIDLARNGPSDIRDEAIFWLGQKASERAVEALGEVVNDEDGETEVQKQAVFSISQLPADQSVPMLIDIAKTHAKAQVRKQAIFWLGQTDDPRALDALIQMARG